ncbi:MAG: hypothetical protein UW75_C0043G0008 [Parcubacteria group bacterium GW2011_GWF2_44_8]|nr:MAG: hypothetical protein UW75_C0043G0008 [Parcubacteria group bacterium GW2011_GWF2_44_8]
MATQIMAFEYSTDVPKAAHQASMVELAKLHDAGWKILIQPYIVNLEPGHERVTRVQVLLFRKNQES